jgi:hypothetical protein
MRLCGATRIKQFATFQSYILLASQIVSSPTYNEK